MQILNRRPQNEQQREKEGAWESASFCIRPHWLWDKQAINGAKEVILHFNPSPSREAYSVRVNPLAKLFNGISLLQITTVPYP